MMYPLLFVSLLAVLMPAPVNSSASLIDCTHATSHCTDCSALCAVAQFYPLLPPPCHPNSTVSLDMLCCLSCYYSLHHTHLCQVAANVTRSIVHHSSLKVLNC